MDYKKSYYILWFGGLGFLAAGVFAAMLKLYWPAVILLLMITVCGVQADIFYRCPHCGGRFSSRSPRRPDFCSRCGQRIDW